MKSSTHVCEPLEPRRLLAAAPFATINGGALRVLGTSDANHIWLWRSGTRLVATMDGTSLNFEASAVQRVVVEAFAGDDRVRNDAGLPSIIFGNLGDDILIGGNNSFLDEGDSIDGGDGNDTIFSGDGYDTIKGGAGNDTADYGDWGGSCLFYIGDADPDGFPLPWQMLVIKKDAFGSGAADHLTDWFETLGGSSHSDQFHQGSLPQTETFPVVTCLGRGGDDFFDHPGARLIEFGDSGNDTFESLIGNPPMPTMFGGDGNDIFRLSRETASIDGGSGIDTIVPDTSTTIFELDLNRFRNVENATEVFGRVIGTPGPNLIQAHMRGEAGDPLSTTIEGGGGNDTLVGGNSPISLVGGDGNDLLIGSPANDILHGGTGNDILRGGDGDDQLFGDAGNDRIGGGNGNDTLNAGPGQDTLYGDAGNDVFQTQDNELDTLYGGPGADRATIDHSATKKDLYGDIETIL